MNDQEQPKASKLKKVAGFAILIAAVFSYRQWKRTDASDEVRAAVHSWVVESEGYGSDPDYFDELLAEAHEAAFAASFHMGGRRTRTRFDSDEYIDAVFTGMRQMAQAEGRHGVAASIQRTHTLYLAAPAAGGH